jgi:hypothetical protein
MGDYEKNNAEANNHAKWRKTAVVADRINDCVPGYGRNVASPNEATLPTIETY